MRKWPLLLGLLLALAPAALRAQRDAAALLAAGNRLYEAGQFAAAAQTYEQLAEMGMRDAVLFYNLGNAYYRLDDVGRAVLNYERAARLAPRDADVQANLALARARVSDRFDAAETAVDELTLFARSWLTVDEMAWGVLALWWACGLSLLALWRGWRPRAARLALGVSALLLLGGLLSIGGRLVVDTVRPEAIIIAAEVPVGSAPAVQEAPAFTLRAGAPVTLLETRDEWVRLSLPGGALQGWAPRESVARIADGWRN